MIGVGLLVMLLLKHTLVESLIMDTIIAINTEYDHYYGQRRVVIQALWSFSTYILFMAVVGIPAPAILLVLNLVVLESLFGYLLWWTVWWQKDINRKYSKLWSLLENLGQALLYLFMAFTFVGIAL